ncbi:flagellar basal body L-ring protein FlgH [Sphingomonas sp.]|uniref:flagellar basal body L-ring protein FlgH n=1 Tax=Sphingomonas sp. TaxID=28214 RepID=UPI003CC5242D
MASRAPSPFAGRWIELALAAFAASLIAAAFAPAPADARRHGPPPPAFDATPPLPPVIPVSATGAIFQSGDGYAALYEGNRARRVGDPLTIVLVERTAATKSANSKLSSGGGASLTPPSTGPLHLFNPTDASLSGSRNFAGGGTADQANSLSGEVSVTVAAVYPNGTMLVQGQKRVTLNRGDEWVRIRGIVRTVDIDAFNRVESTRVADADISYTGRGDVARASRQGWLGRFFGVISPF